MNQVQTKVYSETAKDLKTVNVVIAALGGQGGGVLVDWVSGAARQCGWHTQATSVPGVAQRTGATIYYLEIFPIEASALEFEPVMSLFPMQNNVDLVIASEVVEAGRMVQRGFVSPERTTLVASDHRVYAIAERAAVGNEVVDAEQLRNIATDQAKSLVMFDMQALADEHATMISAALLGAAAGSGALPIARDHFEAQIRHTGKQIDANLSAFAAAYDRASNEPVQHYEPAPDVIEQISLPEPAHPPAAAVIEQINKLPLPVQETALHGARKLADYMDLDYAAEYLTTVARIASQDNNSNDFELSKEFARQLALWAGFEDIIRVAHLKIRKARREDLHREVSAQDNEIVEVRDFFKPRVEEVFGVLPYRVGNWLMNSTFACRIVGFFTAGKQLPSTHIWVFLMLRMLAGLRRFRRSTYAHTLEAQRTQRWQNSVLDQLHDYPKALALTKAASLIKGYGNTRERGTNYLETILDHQATLSSADIDALVNAATADDTGGRFAEMFSKLRPAETAATSDAPTSTP